MTAYETGTSGPRTAHETGTAAPRTAHETARLVLGGALGGITWAAGLRGYMVEIAGPATRFDWSGTFGAILAPAALTGGLLGWAEAIRRTGGRSGWRWLGLSPLTLAIAPVLRRGALKELLATGIGGAGVGVVVGAMAGGYAISGRGPAWVRIASGVPSLAVLVGVAASVPAIAGERLSLTSPRGAWVAVLGASSVAVLTLACSIPHLGVQRPLEDGGTDARPGSAESR